MTKIIIPILFKMYLVILSPNKSLIFSEGF